MEGGRVGCCVESIGPVDEGCAEGNRRAVLDLEIEL